MLFKIKPSRSRKDPVVIDAGNDVKIMSCGIVDSSGVDFVPAGFRFDYKGLVIYIDPVALDVYAKADIILITHAHPDHYSRKAIRGIAMNNTKIICPVRMKHRIKRTGCEVFALKPGEEIKIKGVLIKGVAAYNIRNAFLWLKAHPGKNSGLGYVIQIADTRIFHSGDTHFIKEHQDLKEIDVALVAVGNGKLTMGVEDASALVNFLSPRIVVPMHYEVRRRADIDKLRRIVRGGRFVEPV